MRVRISWNTTVHSRDQMIGWFRFISNTQYRNRESSRLAYQAIPATLSTVSPAPNHSPFRQSCDST